MKKDILNVVVYARYLLAIVPKKVHMSGSDKSMQREDSASRMKRKEQNKRYYEAHKETLKKKRDEKQQVLDEASSRGDAGAVDALERQRQMNREKQRRYYERKKRAEQPKEAAATIPENVRRDCCFC